MAVGETRSESQMKILILEACYVEGLLLCSVGSIGAREWSSVVAFSLGTGGWGSSAGFAPFSCGKCA